MAPGSGRLASSLIFARGVQNIFSRALVAVVSRVSRLGSLSSAVLTGP